MAHSTDRLRFVVELGAELDARIKRTIPSDLYEWLKPDMFYPQTIRHIETALKNSPSALAPAATKAMRERHRRIVAALRELGLTDRSQAADVRAGCKRVSESHKKERCFAANTLVDVWNNRHGLPKPLGRRPKSAPGIITAADLLPELASQAARAAAPPASQPIRFRDLPTELKPAPPLIAGTEHTFPCGLVEMLLAVSWASDNITVASFVVTNVAIAEALRAAARRGLEIIVYTDKLGRSSDGEILLDFLRCDIPIFTTSTPSIMMHMKGMTIDDAMKFSGSSNLTGAGLIQRSRRVGTGPSQENNFEDNEVTFETPISTRFRKKVLQASMPPYGVPVDEKMLTMARSKKKRGSM